MVSTNSFIQAKLQHSTAASRILPRTVCAKGTVRALIQEPWYCKDRIMGLNTPQYTLYSVGGTDRSRAFILARNMTMWMLPGFSCRDLVAVLAKYIADGQRDDWLFLPLICHMIPRILPHQRNFRNSCDIVRMKISNHGVRLQRTSYYMGQHQL